MTRKQFEELQIGSWFHSKRFQCEYLVSHTKEDRHLVERIDIISNDKSPDFWLFSGFDNYDFELGRYPKTEPQSTAQEITCTIQEALEKGLNVGDCFYIEYELLDRYARQNTVLVKQKTKTSKQKTFEAESSLKYFFSKDCIITFKPKSETQEQQYTPAHNELCTILTKNGLGTKAIAVHYNGKISAISIDNEGNADCHFKAEQIEKFLPFPPA